MNIFMRNWNKSAGKTERYIKGKEYVGSSIGCDADFVARDFTMIQKNWDKTKGAQVIHIIHALSPEESKGITPDEFNKMGRELIKKAYPNHAAFVGTHMDKNHLHNHIMLNPVSSLSSNDLENGIRIQNKLFHEDYIRDINDEFSKARGYKIADRTFKGKVKSVNLQIAKDGRFSYSMDIKQKALFSAQHARSFQEHAQIMKDLGIETKIENKNTAYRHYSADRIKFKRGKNLDPRLTNDELYKQFQENRARLPEGNIFDHIANDKEYLRLKAINIQLQVGKSQKQHVIETATTIQHFKNQKIEGVILVNELGERFFIHKDSIDYKDFLEASRLYKNMTVKNASDIQLFKKSGKIRFVANDGKEVWIDKSLDPEIFSNNKHKGYFNLKRAKHYFANSAYNKYKLLPKSKTEREQFIQNDIMMASKFLKNHNGVNSFEFMHYSHSNLFNSLLSKNNSIDFYFKGELKKLERSISRSLSL